MLGKFTFEIHIGHKVCNKFVSNTRMGLRVRPPPSLRIEVLRTRQTRPRLTGPPTLMCENLHINFQVIKANQRTMCVCHKYYNS